MLVWRCLYEGGRDLVDKTLLTMSKEEEEEEDDDDDDDEKSKGMIKGSKRS